MTLIDTECLQREEAAVDEQMLLKEQLQRLQSVYSTAHDELESLKSGGGHAMDSRKYQELENKYRQVKQERIELLRTQGQTSQRLLDLKGQLEQQESIREGLEAE